MWDLTTGEHVIPKIWRILQTCSFKKLRFGVFQSWLGDSSLEHGGGSGLWLECEDETQTSEGLVVISLRCPTVDLQLHSNRIKNWAFLPILEVKFWQLYFTVIVAHLHYFTPTLQLIIKKEWIPFGLMQPVIPSSDLSGQCECYEDDRTYRTPSSAVSLIRLYIFVLHIMLGSHMLLQHAVARSVSATFHLTFISVSKVTHHSREVRDWFQHACRPWAPQIKHTISGCFNLNWTFWDLSLV